MAHSFELRRLGWCLAAWREAAALARHLRSIGAAAASRHLARTTHQVFQASLKVTPGPLLLFPHLQHRQLCRSIRSPGPSALQAWRELAPLLRRQRSMLAAAAARLQHRSLAAAWASWRLFVAARRAQRVQALAVVQRLQHVRLASALVAWREAAAAAAAQRQLARRAIDYFIGSALRRCFETWRSNVAEGRGEAAAEAQYGRLLLLRAYMAWDAAARRRRTLRHKGRLVVLRMQNK